jgi:cytochrome c oxidase subunit II
MSAVRLAVSVAVFSCLALPVFAAGDVRAGRERYAVCAGCHGFAGEGNAAVHAPKLAGLSAWDIVRQLDHFRGGLRGTAEQDAHGKQMATMVLALVDARATEDVIAYLAELPSNAAPPTVNGDVARGREQYALCGACHGAQGEGMEPLNAPKLAGQDDWYVVAQLEGFKQGLRGTHPDDTFGQQMRSIAALLDTEKMLDVAAYIGTL